MALPNIFNQDISEKVIHRVNLLTEGATPLWGKMDVSQMMAHCNGVYEMAYEDNHPKPNFLMTFMLKAFVKTSLLVRNLTKRIHGLRQDC